MVNISLTEFNFFFCNNRFYMFGEAFEPKTPLKKGVLPKKVLRSSTYLKVLFGKPANTNSNIPSNLYRAKICSILLEQQGQGPWISFTSST